MKTYSKFFLKLGLAEFQSGLVLNLFLISDKNPGWVSYKRVSYKKKCVMGQTLVRSLSQSLRIARSLYIWILMSHSEEVLNHCETWISCNPDSLPIERTKAAEIRNRYRNRHLSWRRNGRLSRSRCPWRSRWFERVVESAHEERETHPSLRFEYRGN